LHDFKDNTNKEEIAADITAIQKGREVEESASHFFFLKENFQLLIHGHVRSCRQYSNTASIIVYSQLDGHSIGTMKY
jgi:hypothetical protein